MTQKNTWRSYTQSWLSQGFTLIELLVVVLIIGILAAIAVPQYQKAVEKSRLTEVKTNLGIINKAIDLYILQGGALPLYNSIPLKKVLEETGLELSGGNYQTESDYKYLTKDFTYYAALSTDDIGTNIGILVHRCAHGTDSSSGQCNNDERLYYFETHRLLNSDYQEKYCYHQNTAIGRKICKEMEEQGYSVSQ